MGAAVGASAQCLGACVRVGAVACKSRAYRVRPCI